MEQGWTYRDSGVDVQLAEATVRRIQQLSRRTSRTGVLSDIGGYAGLFKLPESLEKPCLVSSCDGVGTKLKIAIALHTHDTIGIDLVAMCVNDLMCLGATPLFFLDYYACGKLNRERLESVVSGIVDGCRQADCALLGGETAEMPDLYQETDYDLAGFAVGVVEEQSIIDGSRICPGDRIIALASSGLHSNGFSLVRKVLQAANIAWDSCVEGQSLAQELLVPTKIYRRAIDLLLGSGLMKGVAHITGGGIPGNLPRILPAGCQAIIERKKLVTPWIFHFIQKTGNIAEDEMWRTFNMGVGMLLVVDRQEVDQAMSLLKESGEQALIIGDVAPGERKVFFHD